MIFLAYYLKIILFTVAVPLAFGLAVGLCHRLFCRLVGKGCAAPLLLATHTVIMPIREFLHLVAAFVCLHGIDDFRLLQLHDPEGEIGFVEHSYNRRNPIAVFGNFLFAILPAVGGLLLVFAISRLCFGDTFAAFCDTFTALTANTVGGVGACFEVALGFLPALFQSGEGSLLLKFVGCLLLTVLSLGVYVSCRELFEGVKGFLIYAIAAFLFAVVTFLADVRLRGMVTGGLAAFCAGVVALFAVVLIFNALALILAMIVFVYRTLRGEPRTDNVGTEVVFYGEEP
ncbi:MAG: hypothetical protein IJW51_06780 [Clostridia bacterium]|nr:hypothetical protein [Clostridia bacterium]